MQLLAHRGYWTEASQKNSLLALEKALVCGFGIETDIRDHQGQLVVSHDPVIAGAPVFIETFFALYKELQSQATLALNIKSDGIHSLLKSRLNHFEINNYFVFDSSVPESLHYLRQTMKHFTRHSDVEAVPCLYEESQGVWLDELRKSWISTEAILAHLKNGKQVCLVSPELHKREHLSFWKAIKDAQLQQESQLLLCTDFPREAEQYFYG